MNNLIAVAAFFVLSSTVGLAAPEVKNESLDFKPEPEWRVANRASTSGYAIVEFVREGDDIHNWKELLAIQKFVGSDQTSPVELLNRLKALREKECPGVTEWNVIGQDESSVLYEWHAKPCLNWPEQREIARILSGKSSRYYLRYTTKASELTPETRAQWIKAFSAASIIDSNTPVGPRESKDVDEVVPFAMDKVMAALKPAMQIEGCNVTEATANRIECKRARDFSRGTSTGGESVTATLEAQGDKTRVRISTGKGIYGRFGKQNWSTPIYQQAMKGLQEAPLNQTKTQ